MGNSKKTYYFIHKRYKPTHTKEWNF